MRAYFEDLWGRAPEEQPEPPELGRRLQFLLGEAGPADSVLDLGCGAGRFAAELAQASVRVIGADVAQAALVHARRNHPQIDLALAPIEGPLPFEDNAFTLVWASEVIEHVADTAAWLSEVRRVLVPRGRLLLSTPSHGRLRLALGGIERFSEPLGDHLHLYTRRSLRELLSEFGFGEVQVRAVSGPPLLRRMLLARAVR